MSEIKLLKGDCLKLMEKIPDKSINLILTDPPYGIVSNLGNGKQTKKEGYKSYEWDIKADTDKMFNAFSRVLRPNGRALIFSQEPYTSELITKSIPSLGFCYNAYWLKNNPGNVFFCNKAMVNKIETICIFTKRYKKYDFDGENPLRQYFLDVLKFVGVSSYKEINKQLGHRKAEHCFYVTEGRKKIKTQTGEKTDHVLRTGSTQFSLCTEETYQELIEKFHINQMHGFKDYKVLKETNSRFFEENSYKFPSPVFNLWEGKKSKPNVLEYAKDSGGYHPTQKPVLLLEDLVKTFSNEGDTVLDAFMGSGSVGIACINTKRKFIGIELNDSYFGVAKGRIEKYEQQGKKRSQIQTP